ncbi:hypothetical protein NMG60_11017162 [Bertholletia excelsa]
MTESESPERGEDEEEVGVAVREIRYNGQCMKAAEVEAKLNEGNIEAAESSLREGLSLNAEEARALLGKIEYQRGNLEVALRIFNGIDLQETVQKIQPLLERQPSKKGQKRPESTHVVNTEYSATLVLEGLYLKAKSLQKLGKLTEAANECKSVCDAVENIICSGTADVQGDKKLQETVSRVVELLPELWRQAGCHNEALSAYRRALLNQWKLENECCARIQKGFAMFLLYSGVEAGPPNLSLQVDGSYVPKNNLEEAILLLMIVMRKFNLANIKWDPSVMEHLIYALSLCSQTSVLAKQLEEVVPGVFNRIDRWKATALCYSGAGEDKVSLNLLRKSLHKHENPNDLVSLLLAAKICSEDALLASEGVKYAERAILNAKGVNEHLKGVGLRMLGLCLGKQTKVSSSDFERSRLQSEALKSLNQAIGLECNNSDIIFELAVQYAEQRNLNAALRFAKQFIDATGGSVLRGWRLLALILSAQQRFSEAEVVTDAALDETGKWEQGPLLRLKAKLKVSRSQPTDAIETYRYLLALVQANRKHFGPHRTLHQIEDDKVNEFEVWQGLANLYSSLSHWSDAEICLEKAKALFEYSPETLHTEAQGEPKEALSLYVNSTILDARYLPSKVLIGAALVNRKNALPVARSILSDALRIEPMNRTAWYYLGLVHKNDGRMGEALDCFQAATMLGESDPIESFSSVSGTGRSHQ